MRADLTLEPCYVFKQDNIFAHGGTLREAHTALMDKLLEKMPIEDRVAAFVDAHQAEKSYSNTDFFEWHHRLTGSCKAGREAFAADHQVNMGSASTVSEFIALTENAYGGDIIRQLKEFYPIILSKGN